VAGQRTGGRFFVFFGRGFHCRPAAQRADLIFRWPTPPPPPPSLPPMRPPATCYTTPPRPPCVLCPPLRMLRLVLRCCVCLRYKYR
jgi:hypothetical protein